MNGFRRFISEEKLPYLITVLFAAFGWVVTYSVDRVDKSPTVVYRLTEQQSPKAVRVRVENITRDKVFQSLRFVFMLTGSDSFASRPKASPVAPAWVGEEAPTVEPHSATFVVAQLEPGWKIDFEVEYEGIRAPEFYLEDSKDVVRLVKPSVETFFVQHEMAVMFFTLIIYFVVIILVMTKRRPSPSMDGDGQKPQAGQAPLKRESTEGNEHTPA